MKQKSILSNGATREKLEVRKNTMGRQENIEIFEDTFALCKRNSTLRDAIEQSAKKQKLYPKGVECTEKQAITYAQPAKIIVSPKRTLEAAMPYAYAGKKVCIHNFASAANPGGGVTKGSSAQEEAICRCSTLYPNLKEEILWKEFYAPHRPDLPFVVVKFSGIISSSLGQTQTNIGNMFDYAKRTPCVLCIDEIDALGTMRGKKDDVAEMSRVVIALMQELDNIKNDVIVIGTTNRPDQLDEALIRRFVQRHEVKPLNQDDIRELVRKFNDSVGYPMDDIQMDVFCSQFGIEATANTVISACTERIIEKNTEEVKQEQA